MSAPLPGLARALARALPDGWALREEDPGSADLAFLATLYASTRADELAAVPWSGEQKLAFLQQQCSLQRQHYRLHYAEAGFWILENDRQPVGRIYVFDSPAELRLMDIAILPAHRRQGIGGQLIRALQVEATGRRKAIGLHVEPGNPANRLYQRLGFMFVEDRGAYRYLAWQPAAVAGGVS